jgi:hypothetical protein
VNPHARDSPDAEAMIRETQMISFIASLAGAAIFTALAVLIPANSPFWKWILWSAVVVSTMCAIAPLTRTVRRRIYTKEVGEPPERLLCTFAEEVAGAYSAR